MRLRTTLAAAMLTIAMVPLTAPGAHAYTAVPSSCYAEMDTVDSTGNIVQVGIDGAESTENEPFDVPTTMDLRYVPKALTLVSSSETSTDWRYRYYALSASGTLRYHVFVVSKTEGVATRLSTKAVKTGWTGVTDLVATTHKHLYSLSSTGRLTRWTLGSDATLGTGTYLKTVTGIKGLNYAGSVTTTINGAPTAKRDLMFALTSTGGIKAFHIKYWGSGSDYTYSLKSSGYSLYETIAIGACTGNAGVMVLHDNDGGRANGLYDTNIINGISSGELSDRGGLGVTWLYRSYGS